MRKVRNNRATVHQTGSKARIPVLSHSCWQLQRSPTNGRQRVSTRGRRIYSSDGSSCSHLKISSAII